MTDSALPSAKGSAPRRAFIKNWGCQMNAHDSERIADLLEAQGFDIAALPGDPAALRDTDLVVLNTCHIRAKAADKVYSQIGRLRAASRAQIVVAGCLAQAEGAEILARAPADLVIGPQAYHRLPALLAPGRARRRARRVELDFAAAEKFARLPPRRAPASGSAFLVIQEGCDRFCTFCVVPYTRGGEISRPAPRIEAEARALAAAGAREIIVLGQNVNAWRGRCAQTGARIGLGGLLRRLARIPGLRRLRYTTSHPADMDDGLIRAHGEVASLMPALHLPVQSGSDSVLRAMNRRHSADDYRRIVARLRRARGDIALSSDFIVGFPGERPRDFEATLALVRELGFAAAYAFQYSPRPGTPAAGAGDQIPGAVKAERLARLRALLDAQQRRFNRRFSGQEVEVLFTGPGRHPGQMTGRTRHGVALNADGPSDLAGRIVPVRVLAALGHSLQGRLESSANHPPRRRPPIKRMNSA